ncbi:NAD(P)/FAD-dependent oxidoreductase [Sphingomonas montanisoli]|uniref:NAD(P)/FAD-dependent oxidoreductase n=1 Tax=Sphingomonas montanisoli TaxID=2606412 RepID=A0A5D9C5X7_9SPHN|nr:NAD(P)/FAD-dependent oxidoreductase [Sphingomonas montanisoli]TZG27258.1 NAD(P)/FAD-dependent oxidoreductase [Sphingomonas montanisoli]
MSPAEQHSDVAIIGAGPAGLTAGYLLGKHGFSVTLVEKDAEQVGGISRTVEHAGFRFDIGGHRFFSKSREVVDLWDELLPNDFIERPRMSRIYYRGKFYDYPLRAFDALRKLGLIESSLCMLSFFRAKLFPNKDVRSFDKWVINQFGERLFGIFFKTYTEKVWGMPCEDMSADWAAQRIKGLSLGKAVFDGIKRSLGLNRRPNDGMQAKTLLESFRYPRKGPGMMWDAARDRILEHGNRFLMGHALHQASWDEAAGHWRITIKAGGGKTRVITADHLISSAPVRELVARLHPMPKSMPNAMALNYRDFLTVALMIRSEDLFPDNWIYIHEDKVKVGRIQNFRSWSPEMVPDEALACVGLEYFCFEGDGLWSSTDEGLIALATAELARLGLCDPRDVVGGAVVRQEKAYPVYDDHYAGHVAAIRAELEARYPTLQMVGRNGMHRYNNQDHAMMTAMLAVRNIVEGRRRHDLWAVNEDAEYHEAGSEGDDAGVAAALRSERLVPRRLKKAA